MSPQNHRRSISPGALAGIIAVPIILTCMSIGGLVWWLIRRRAKQKVKGIEAELEEYRRERATMGDVAGNGAGDGDVGRDSEDYRMERGHGVVGGMVGPGGAREANNRPVNREVEGWYSSAAETGKAERLRRDHEEGRRRENEIRGFYEPGGQ